MICQKTGAQLYLSQYDLYVIGDVYRTNDGALVARCTNGPENERHEATRPMVHYLIADVSQWFDRNDRGSLVSTLVAEREFVREYGYHGIPWEEVK